MSSKHHGEAERAPRDDSQSPRASASSNGLTSLAVAAIATWCLYVLYLLVAVQLGFRHPFGQSTLTFLLNELFHLTPTDAYLGKLDLPIALIHVLVLYKCARYFVGSAAKSPATTSP